MTCAICLEAFYNTPGSETSRTGASEESAVVATNCILSQTRPAPNRNYIQCPVCRNRVYENALLKLHNDWKCDCPTVSTPKSLEVETSDRKWESELITLLETVKVGGKPTEGLISSLNRMIDMSTGRTYNFFTKIKKAINDLTTQVLHESKAKDDSKIALQNAILEHGNILSINQNMITSLTEANDSLNNEIENLRSRLKTANDTLNRLNILRTLNNSSEFPSMEATIRRNLFLERINELDRGGWVNLLRDLHNINLHNEKEKIDYKRQSEKAIKEKEELSKEFYELSQKCKRLESRNRQFESDTQLERDVPRKTAGSHHTTPTDNRQIVTPVSRINHEDPIEISDSEPENSTLNRRNTTPTRHMTSSSNQPSSSTSVYKRHNNLTSNPFVRVNVPLPDPSSIYESGTAIVNNIIPSSSNTPSARAAALFNSTSKSLSKNNSRDHMVGRAIAVPKSKRAAIRKVGMDD
ncbi:hypothetical protein CONCODRAFT_7852 [Conidiobolus coronatus NRRL 28638]|uniref:Uncharacterized protein n=1 Tax=Conidiobolus coronatus (strain ATCC 28846 / CBS 209.66 / NRRL 28638) TaxID=796925 RepID=A0A137P3U2_CONC2|nr:hypothetical protein CONCODRAFT_7852 [Conidiobolus coronatus NRRL 28638]|eukprot:KXN69695.1 hypothetical protein CONCODRAFT_7852 [Conidiobolus coronatus NRRL 28638]